MPSRRHGDTNSSQYYRGNQETVLLIFAQERRVSFHSVQDVCLARILPTFCAEITDASYFRRTGSRGIGDGLA